MRTIIFLQILLALMLTSAASAQTYPCTPTSPDALGPFYREGAPVRNSIGHGYLLLGEVKSAADCAPLAGAKIEAWTTGPDGRYDERWRATLFAGEDGRYHFESHYPGPYGSRPPHIHLLVTAPGFAELITQHYPQPGSAMAIFDLVLIPTP
jgi:protocatechuate 3,4-dioxygenase beta subunit